jgi:SAM-dependent methyltransferase
MGYTTQYYQTRSKHPMWSVETGVIQAMVGTSGRGVVVEVGCGTGELLSLLGPERGIGIDWDETAVELARSRSSGNEFRVGDACDLGLANETVDCIVSMHLVEHLPELETGLKNWHSVLKPGGRLAIVTPNARFCHPEVFADPDHRHIYDGPELSARVGRSGFTVEKVFTVGMWGLRQWPLVWRYQNWFYQVKFPPLPGVRWRGQSLCLSAVKS